MFVILLTATYAYMQATIDLAATDLDDDVGQGM